MLTLRGREEITIGARNHRDGEESLSKKYIRIEKEYFEKYDDGKVPSILNNIMRERKRLENTEMTSAEKMEKWILFSKNIIENIDIDFSNLEQQYLEVAYAYIVKEHSFIK